MFVKRFGRIVLLLVLAFVGIWLIAQTSSPAPESMERQQAIQRSL